MLAAAYDRGDEGAPPDAARFARYTDCDPYHRDGLWLVGELDGKPATALRIAPREIALVAGGRAKVGGIANVGTDPSLAGRGLGSELLRRAIELMREEGFAHSLLYTSTPDFYARLGWRSARPAKRVVRSAGVLFEPPGAGDAAGWTIAEAGGEHWPQLAALYDRTIAEVPGSLVRSGAYWEQWIGGLALPLYGARCLVASRGGRVAAYLAGRVTGEGGAPELQVIEGAALPGDNTGPLPETAILRELARRIAPSVRAAAWPALSWLDEAFAPLSGNRTPGAREGAMLLRLDDRAAELPAEFLLTGLDVY